MRRVSFFFINLGRKKIGFVTIKSDLDAMQQRLLGYIKALDDHGSELCRTRSVIKWPRQSPVYMAKVSPPRIGLNMERYEVNKEDETDSVGYSDHDPRGIADKECSVCTRQ